MAQRRAKSLSFEKPFVRMKYVRTSNDETVRFLGEVSERIQSWAVLGWWRSNKTCFPTIEKTTRDVLYVQAPAVASEKCFSLADNVIKYELACLTKDHIRTCMRLRYPKPLLGSVRETA